MPALFGVTVKKNLVVDAEAECAVVPDVARCKAVRQAVVPASRTIARIERGAEIVPVARDVPAQNFPRRSGDDGERGGIAVVFRGVEKTSPGRCRSRAATSTGARSSAMARGAAGWTTEGT